MKKNLLSVLVLVLLIVNIALSAIMMISITGTNQKTAELVTNIATVMNLELYNPGGTEVAEVSLADTDTFDLGDQLMIPLANSKNADGSINTKQEYIIFNLSLLQNMGHEDYKVLGGAENITTRVSLIRDTVNTVVGKYTIDECRNDFTSIREQILKEIQQLFGSNFIYKIAISGVKYG